MRRLRSSNNGGPIILTTEEISNDLVFPQHIKDTSVQRARYLPKNVLRKREFSHSGTEEMHVERKVPTRKTKHVTYLIMLPGDMQCVCTAMKALKVRLEEHKPDMRGG